MASLKEIKERIASVSSTRKITSAMNMVASAKLKKSQSRIETFLNYEKHLNSILNSFLSSQSGYSNALSEVREIKRVAVVVLSSNTSLCGAFNSNIEHLLNAEIADLNLDKEKIEIYAVGKKVKEYVKKGLMYATKGDYTELMDKPAFEGAKQIADQLVEDFVDKRIDKVILVYNHFKNNAVQVPSVEQFLPIKLEDLVSGENGNEKGNYSNDYIVEPDLETILSTLIPKYLRSKIFSALLDSSVAEHAARSMAMKIATDNADDLLEQLTIQYNKQRQQDITNELLDIVSYE